MPCVPSLTLLLLFLITHPAGAGSLEITVDCGAGDDLATALADVLDGATGPVIVNVLGTCAGPIEITAHDVTLRGTSPEASAIEGVAAHGVRNLRLERLRISDAPRGVDAKDAEVTIDGCDIARTDIGVRTRGSSVALTRVTLRDGRMGIEARRSRVDLGFSTIHGISDEGISATEFSEVVIFRSTAASDGLSVRNSTLVATLSELEGSIHARTYSRVSLAGSSGSSSALHGDISASNSEVFLFQLPIDGTVSVQEAGVLTAIGARLGQVRLGLGADARISAGRVAQSVLADGFSTVQLLSSVVLGPVVCTRGSDAICEGSEVARVEGCGGCDA